MTSHHQNLLTLRNLLNFETSYFSFQNKCKEVHLEYLKEVFYSSSTFFATSYTHKELRTCMATKIDIRERVKAGVCNKNVQIKAGRVK